MIHVQEISNSPDLKRIKALPKRGYTPGDLVDQMTRELKTAQGTWTLKPIQAQALYEILEHQGLLGPIKVGGGKTLISLLAPLVLGLKRPLLLMPASLIDRTREDQGKLMRQFKIPRNICLYSYEMLGRVNAAAYLSNTQPDGIICDEAHRLKNEHAGVTRRVARYMKERPETKFVAISGTLLSESIEDFAHLSGYALKEGSPLPLDGHTVTEWANALNEPKGRVFDLYSPRKLIEAFPTKEHVHGEKAEARAGYRDRILHTPGVVSSQDEHVGCSIEISAKTYKPSEVTMEHFRTLRRKFETPDGWALSQAIDVWRHAQELAIGMHYVLDPRPPKEWLEARKAWAKFVRGTLIGSKFLDTELQVANECRAGRLPMKYFDAWQKIKDTFTPNCKAIWHDDTALELCAKWAKAGPGIIWVRHTFFAQELTKRTGLAYYGSEGRNQWGEHIEKGDPSKAVIASIDANCTGMNLQHWNRNLLTTSPGGATKWEQLLGRTHRDGQLADSVTFEILVGCKEHYEGLERATEKARQIQETIGHSQKILLADLSWPQLHTLGNDSRWEPNGIKEKGTGIWE